MVLNKYLKYFKTYYGNRKKKHKKVSIFIETVTNKQIKKHKTKNSRPLKEINLKIIQIQKSASSNAMGHKSSWISCDTKERPF